MMDYNNIPSANVHNVTSTKEDMHKVIAEVSGITYVSKDSKNSKDAKNSKSSTDSKEMHKGWPKKNTIQQNDTLHFSGFMDPSPNQNNLQINARIDCHDSTIKVLILCIVVLFCIDIYLLTK